MKFSHAMQIGTDLLKPPFPWAIVLQPSFFDDKHNTETGTYVLHSQQSIMDRSISQTQNQIRQYREGATPGTDGIMTWGKSFEMVESDRKAPRAS
jgi:hypothetical protein